MSKRKNLLILSCLELLIAGLIIWSDFFVPTLFVLILVSISLFIRKQHVSSLGYKNVDNWPEVIAKILGLTILWTIFTLTLNAPFLDHILGLQRDVSAFANLKGNVGLLIVLLLVSWTLAAVGEETVYRGFLHTRAREIFSKYKWNYAAGIFVSASFFGLAHIEQGLAGVILTFLDAIYFSVIRRHFNDNLWAAVLAHGLLNTVGIVGFFVIGPITAFW